MIWVVTGSRHITDRDWLSDRFRDAYMSAGRPDRVYIGDARGVDYEAKLYCIGLGIEHRIFRADWGQHGNKAGPIRNREMLSEAVMAAGPEGVLCLGFPLAGPRSKSRGTWDCIDRAVAEGIQTVVTPCRGRT